MSYWMTNGIGMRGVAILIFSKFMVNAVMKPAENLTYLKTEKQNLHEDGRHSTPMSGDLTCRIKISILLVCWGGN